MVSSRTHARLIKAYEQRNWQMVLHRAEQVLAAHQADAQVHFMLGVACLWLRQTERSVEALHAAVALDASNADYMAYYAMALGSVRRLSQAHQAADRAMDLAPKDAAILDMLGSVYMQVGAVEAAAQARQQAVTLAPERAQLRFNLGYVLAAMGDGDAAERELEAGIARDERQWSAHLSLAKFRRQNTDHHHLGRLCALSAKYANDAVAQMFLNMALAKESEDMEDYAAAFTHYTRGKGAGYGLRPGSAGRDAAMFDALVKAFPDVEMPVEDGCEPDAPIFIIGMPRTGTTLLSRMLSRHRDVLAAGELQNFATALQLASGSRVALLSLPDLAAATAHIDWPQLGTTYIDSTRPATAVCPRFTDDMPLNFLYAGFIARALPRAKILCLRRNPLDTCVSNLRNLFRLESGFYDYSLDLLDTGRYYIGFDRLMAHWRQVLPGRIFEVSYESLVTTTEPVLHEVLAFCGLSWDEACAHPEGNLAPINTPQAWQVRAPVFTHAIGRWRHYAQQLESLRELLTAAGIALPE